MNRLLFALGLTLIASLAVAQERTPAAANAEVYFIAPQTGAKLHGPVIVCFG